MEKLFDLKCRNCGAPVGYDIVNGTYRCPSCGQVSGIQETHKQFGFRPLNGRDRAVIASQREILSCPGCGAELLYEASDQAAVCPFCGKTPIRREFQQSDQFPDSLIPFVLTRQEAAEQLKLWAEQGKNQSSRKWILDNLDSLRGYYLPYSLVRGPVSGFVVRENVNREFKVRGYLEDALISTSRQLDNRVLDAIEPFDLNGLKPFEQGYLAGQGLKLPDLSGAKRQRRTLREAGEKLRQQLIPRFHTAGIRVHLYPSDLLETPILLPVYLLKVGRRLAVVNGQTGRVAVQEDRQQKRSPLWMLEPALLICLVLLFLRLLTGGIIPALTASIPLVIMIVGEYRGGHFSLFGQQIQRGKQQKATRWEKTLLVEETTALPKNPFSTEPVFWEMQNGVPAAVNYRFYPLPRILSLTIKTLGLYFLPLILGGILHYVFHLGAHFRPMGSIPWFWIFGIFTMVYIFTGIRCDAYEKPWVYDRKTGKLLGTPSSRSLPFFPTVGLDLPSMTLWDTTRKPKQRLMAMYLILISMLIISILTTIL